MLWAKANRYAYATPGISIMISYDEKESVNGLYQEIGISLSAAKKLIQDLKKAVEQKEKMNKEDEEEFLNQ